MPPRHSAALSVLLITAMCMPAEATTCDAGEDVRKLQQVQQKMSQVQDELAGRTVTAAAGGNMVSVTVNGRSELIAIRIDREVINPDDGAMLEDLVLTAVNEGIKKAKEMARVEMRKLTGGINIPGLF